jgi:hypothetical protein
MNTKGKLVIGSLVAGAALVIACGSGTTKADEASKGTKDIPLQGAAASAPPVVVATKAAAAVVDPNSITGDGTFAVGSQVKPGTYRTVVPSDSWGCYYERLKGASGEFSDIISNGNANSGQQVLVTIKASDKYFHVERCGTWTLVN